MTTVPDASRTMSSAHWFARGARQIFSIPAFILMMAFVGFGGLARDAGLTVIEAMVLAFSVWALPSAVIVVGAVGDAIPFYTTVFAVMLASIRLMPMTMALVPVLRGEKTRTWQLVAVSHFIAITAWVHAMMTLPNLPREARLAFFAGFGATLAVVNTAITGLSHMLSTNLPPVLTAGLVFLTPTYFLMSMTEASRLPSERIAVGLGLVLGPVFHLIAPQVDLLLCGLVGGTISYGAARLVRLSRGEQ